MGRTLIRTIAILSVFALLLPIAWSADPPNRRLTVRKGTLNRNLSTVELRAIETPKLFLPGVTEEDIARGFIDVSAVGGTGVWFDLEGFSEDGASLKQENVDTLRRVKSECIYRYIAPVCRVLGENSPEGADARKAAIRIAAETFQDDYAMIYWIDGPRSDELVAEFKKLAPKLTVLSPRGGDLDLVYNREDAQEDRPTVVFGEFTPLGNPVHSLLPAGQASYDTIKAAYNELLDPDKCAPSTVGLTEQEIADGFVSLFNGRSLDCWLVTGDDTEAWAVKDGVIEWMRRGGGVVLSRKEYGDFVLRAEWKLFQEGANSGMFMRAPIQNRMSKMGFEFQMMGDYGVEPEEHITGAIYDVLSPLKNGSNPVGEWNEFEIRLEGPHYKATLNGEVVQDVNFDDIPELKYRLRKGHIGLQDHNNKVMFRNIRIKEL